MSGPRWSLTALLALAVGAAGCVRSGLPPIPLSPPAEESVVVRSMPVGKRAALPGGFPLEVPVIDGSVVETSAAIQTGSWVYAVETTGPADAVARWYARAYYGAQWDADTPIVTSDGALRTVEVRFTKGSAESVVRVGDGVGGRATVRVSVGIGSGAPRTY